MTNWSLPPDENHNDQSSDDSRMSEALEALVTATTAEAIQGILEERQEILFPDDALLTLCLNIIEESMLGNGEAAQGLQIYLWLLDYARTHGIKEACERLMATNERFEIPPARLIELLSKAIAGTSDLHLWAELHVERGDCHMMAASQQETRGESIEKAIADYQTALSVFTQEQFAPRWAAIHKQLGSVYPERIYGNLAENLKQAITDYNAALSIFTLESAPYEYREIQVNLAQIYIRLRQREAAERTFAEVRRATKLLAERAETEREDIGSFDYGGQELLDADVLNSAIEALLETNNWAQIENLLRQQAPVLLSNQAVDLLRQQVIEAEETSSDGRSEFLRMRLQLLENARVSGVESAWQRFTSDYLDAVEAIQMLQFATSQDEISRTIREKQEVYLSTPVLALLYSTIKEHNTNNNVTLATILEQTMRYLLDARRGKISLKEPEQQSQQEERENVFQQASNLFPPGIVQYFDYNDPYLMLILQEIQKLTREQMYALIPFISQMTTILQNPVNIADISSNMLKQIDRQETPYLWAMLHYGRVAGYLNHPQGNYEQALDDCNAALSVFTRDVTAQMWAHSCLIRACVYMQPVINRQVQNTDTTGLRQQLEQALSDFDAALSVFTREKMPLHWAIAIGTRGFAYGEWERITGNVTQNIEQALADFDAALSVLSVEGTPTQLATMYLYQGIMYFRLMTGDRKENIEKAIESCNAALSAFPSHRSQEESEQWAAVLMVRALAYMDRSEGERKKNLEQALADLNAALTVNTRTRFPEEWARTMTNRGNVYLQRIEGNRSQNLECALSDYNDALTVFTKEETPSEWGQTLTNRSQCYQERIAGERGQNQENALKDLNEALLVFTRERGAIERGMVLNNRGSLYLLRIAEDRKQNFEHALADFSEAIDIFSPDETALLRAKVLVNRGTTYRSLAMSIGLVYRGFGFRTFTHRLFSQQENSITSILGGSEHLFRQALDDFDAALTVLTRESTPREWAQALRERAMTHAFHVKAYFTGNREEHLRQGIDDFTAALTVLSPDNAPMDWAITRLNRALLYREMMSENHQEVAELALADTQAAMTIFTRQIAPANYRRIQDIRASIFEASGRWAEAHDALLEARKAQRDLVAAASSDRNRSDIIAEFALIDTYVRDARAMLHLAQPDLNEVTIALEEGRAQSLRAALDLDTITLQKIHDPAARERATAFLAARNRWRKCQHEMLEPETGQAVGQKDVRARHLEEAYTAFIEARKAIRQHDNPDFMASVSTFEQIAHAVRTPEEALVYLVADSSLDGSSGMAILVTRSTAGRPQVLQPVHLPELKDMRLFDLLEMQENTNPQVREKEAIAQLGQLGMNKLAEVLSRQGIRKVILVTYGWLSLFPLSCAFVTQPNGRERPFGEIFETTFAPSAQAAAVAYERSRRSYRERPLLLMAGNPQPRPLAVKSLPFSAAEADTTQLIAKGYGYPAAHIRYLKPREVTKENVVEALKRAWYAHLAVHGEYRVDDPRRSRLILAGSDAMAEEKRTLYLNEALDGVINLSGLRLLMLSACETAIIDMNRTPDEMLGLAPGFLQAGVAGVIASLWAVDDHATYLLMSRFAQLYLDPQGIWSPARALAEAQRWLREEATYSVLAKYDPTLLDKLANALREEGISEPLEGNSRSIPSRLRTLRPHHEKVIGEIQLNSALRAKETPDELPYKDPKYWAAFIVNGC